MKPASAIPGISRATKEILKGGLSAPICLTWEITYACNLSCIHCLSASGLKDPRELNTAQALALVDTFREMGVFYINIGGGASPGLKISAIWNSIPCWSRSTALLSIGLTSYGL